MAIECSSNLLNMAVSIGSVCVGGTIGYLSARRIATLTARRVACAKLRAAFAPTLAILYLTRHHGTHDKPPVDATIKAALLNHGAAIEEFRLFVPASEQGAYQASWESYRQKAAQSHFDTVSEEWGLNLEEGELLDKNIHAILRFAEN